MNEQNDTVDINEITHTPLENETAEASEEASAELTDGADTQESITDNEHPDADTIRAMREELESLRTQLSESRAAYARLSNECEEFSKLYPGVPITSIPDSIWESFKSGVPLAAAYALHEKKEKLASEKAGGINEKNRQLSSGAINTAKNEEYFSPAEVRAMSAAEVRANYAKIITSMSKWH